MDAGSQGHWSDTTLGRETELPDIDAVERALLEDPAELPANLSDVEAEEAATGGEDEDPGDAFDEEEEDEEEDSEEDNEEDDDEEDVEAEDAEATAPTPTAKAEGRYHISHPGWGPGPGQGPAPAPSPETIA